jgi:HK97 gp10 family phage protein
MVTVCTPEEMAKRIAGIQKGCEDGIRKGLVRACAIAETQAKKNLTPGSTPYTNAPFDTGLLRGHIGYSIEMESVEEWVARVGVEANTKNKDGIEIDTYALYVHEGTRPHYAPMEAIKAWAERKSRGGSSFPWFAIWLKIAKEGTEAKPFLMDAVKDTKNQYMPVIDEEYKKALIMYAKRFS